MTGQKNQKASPSNANNNSKLTYYDVVSLLNKQTEDIKNGFNDKVTELLSRIDLLEQKVSDKDNIINELKEEIACIKKTIEKQDSVIVSLQKT